MTINVNVNNLRKRTILRIWHKSIPGWRKSKNNVSETRIYLGCSRKSKMASGAGAEEQGREWKERREPGTPGGL